MKLLNEIKTMLTKEGKGETQYLLSTEANRKHLEDGMKQAAEGKTTSISIEDLWK